MSVDIPKEMLILHMLRPMKGLHKPLHPTATGYLSSILPKGPFNNSLIMGAARALWKSVGLVIEGLGFESRSLQSA